MDDFSRRSVEAVLFLYRIPYDFFYEKLCEVVDVFQETVGDLNASNLLFDFQPIRYCLSNSSVTSPSSFAVGKHTVSDRPIEFASVLANPFSSVKTPLPSCALATSFY